MHQVASPWNGESQHGTTNESQPKPNARLNPANTPARIAPHAIIEAYRGTISLPFESGEHRRIAVKSVDDRGGVESLKVVEVE
jgi:hypothetical protein